MRWGGPYHRWNHQRFRWRSAPESACDRRRPANRNGYADAYTHSNGHSYIYAYTNGCGHGDVYAYSYSHSHSHSNVHTYSNSDCYSGNPDSDANMHTGLDLVRHFERFWYSDG
jgi:hypothetical protein